MISTVVLQREVACSTCAYVRPIQSKDMHVSMTWDSKLEVGMIMIVNTYLPLRVGMMYRWSLSQLPHDNWDRLQPLPLP